MGSTFKASVACAVATSMLIGCTDAVSKSTVVKDHSGSLQDRPTSLQWKVNDNLGGDYQFPAPTPFEGENDNFNPFMEPFNDGRLDSPDRFLPTGSGVKFENPVYVDIYSDPSQEVSVEHDSFEEFGESRFGAESRREDSHITESHIDESKVESSIVKPFIGDSIIEELESHIGESHIEQPSRIEESSYIEQPYPHPSCDEQSFGEEPFGKEPFGQGSFDGEFGETVDSIMDIIEAMNEAEAEEEAFEMDRFEEQVDVFAEPTPEEFSPDIETFSDEKGTPPDVEEEFFMPHANSALEASHERYNKPKTSELIRKICRSREFQPTTANYWISETDKWLREFTVKHMEEPDFKEFGLFNFIAQKHLGCEGFYSDGHDGFPHLVCDIKCENIVEKVHDVHEARRVLFVLSSAAALGEKAVIIHETIRDVPKHVASYVKRMPTKGWHHSPSEAVSAMFFETIETALTIISPVLHKEKTILEGRNSLQVAKHYYDQACQASHHASKGDDAFKFDKIFDSEYQPSLTDLDFAHKGHSEVGALLPEGMMPSHTPLGRAVSRWGSVLEDARAYVIVLESGDVHTAMDESSKVFKKIFGAGNHASVSAKPELSVEKYLTIAANEAKERLVSSFLQVLRGATYTGSALGTTDISIILRPGHHLPSLNTKSITEFKESAIERKIARELFMKLFNNSLRSDPVYISCTRDIKAKSCSSDRSGPQELKFCTPEGYVCYMYEWNERPKRSHSHNIRPKGHENWNEKPWGIDVQHIIQSSFNNHMKKPCNEPTIATLGESRHTNHFKIPVCVSDYNWNTPIDAGFTCKTDKHCHAKSMPCHCGAWGTDTLSVWKDLGLTESPHYHYFSATVCPRQIKERIHDDLERYIALCKLDIRRTSSKSRVDGHKKSQGGDRYCGVILNYIESMPLDPVTHEMPRCRDLDRIDPTVKYAFLCHIQRGGRGCQMYKKTFDDLLNAWQEKNSMV